jgi:hypothetical protein
VALPEIGAEIGVNSPDAVDPAGGRLGSAVEPAGGGRGGAPSQQGLEGGASQGGSGASAEDARRGRELRPEQQGGATRRSEQASYQVAALFQRLQAFDVCLLDLNRCTSLAECVPLVKSRHQQCEELLPIIAEVLRAQRERAALLAERMRRLAERMEVVDAARAKVVEAQARAEDHASRHAVAMSNSTDNELRSSRSYSDGRRSKRTSSRSSSTIPADTVPKSTDRAELKLKLRKSPRRALLLLPHFCWCHGRELTLHPCRGGYRRILATIQSRAECPTIR